MGSSSGGISSIEQVNKQTLDNFKSGFNSSVFWKKENASLVDHLQEDFEKIKNHNFYPTAYYQTNHIKVIRDLIYKVESYFNNGNYEFLNITELDYYFKPYFSLNKNLSQYLELYSKEKYIDMEYRAEKYTTNYIGTIVFIIIFDLFDIYNRHGTFSHTLEVMSIYPEVIFKEIGENFTLGALLLVFFSVYDYIRNKFLLESLNKTPDYQFPKKIDSFLLEYEAFKTTIESQRNEALENLENNKKIYNDLKKRVANTLMDLAERKHILMERLELMQVELEHAKKMGENLTEQHEKTEAIRAKYAREMMDAQVMLAEQSDQALKEKLAMVNAMMGV